MELAETVQIGELLPFLGLSLSHGYLVVWHTHAASRTSPFSSGGCGDGLSASADRLDCSTLGWFHGSLVELG